VFFVRAVQDVQRWEEGGFTSWALNCDESRLDGNLDCRRKPCQRRLLDSTLLCSAALCPASVHEDPAAMRASSSSILCIPHPSHAVSSPLISSSHPPCLSRPHTHRSTISVRIAVCRLSQNRIMLLTTRGHLKGLVGMNVLHLETFAGRIVDGIVAEVERSALKM